MKKGYNVYNLVEKFKKWLLAEKPKIDKKSSSRTTLKNYASDLRHFIGWSMLKIKAKDNDLKLDKLNPNEFILLLTEDLIKDYKNYLILNNIPLQTINRRLSTLRKFFAFCIDQKWINTNPAKKIKNLPSLSKKTKLLKDFKKYLRSLKNFPEKRISIIITDVKEFLEFAQKV